MPPSTIIICRHAQAEHNVANDYSIPDAPLTSLGKQQSSRLPTFVPREVQDQIDLVVSSPLKRTLQTTLIGWAPTLERLGGKGKVVCLPQLQECNDYPCDTGSSREVLESDPEVSGFDFSLLTPDWTSKQGQFAADQASLNRRAQWVRQWLRSREEKTILVVGHGDIIRRITGGPAGNSTHAWANAEARSYEFDPQFIQTDEAWLTTEGMEVSAGGWQPTSTEFAGKSDGQEGSLPSLTENTTESSTATKEGKRDLLAELEGKVAEKLQSVSQQTKELEILEARLKEADERKAALEARGAGAGVGGAGGWGGRA